MTLEEGRWCGYGLGHANPTFWNPLSWNWAGKWSDAWTVDRVLQELMHLPTLTQASMTHCDRLSSVSHRSNVWVQWMAGVMVPEDRTQGWFLWRNATGGTNHFSFPPNMTESVENKSSFEPQKFIICWANQSEVLSRVENLKSHAHPVHQMAHPLRVKPTPYHIDSNNGYLMPWAYTLLLFMYPKYCPEWKI